MGREQKPLAGVAEHGHHRHDGSEHSRRREKREREVEPRAAGRMLPSAQREEADGSERERPAGDHVEHEQPSGHSAEQPSHEAAHAKVQALPFP